MIKIAVISFHTCPLATLGGKDTGGMNVYVRDLTKFLGKLGVHVDVFTRSQDVHVPHVLHDLGYGNRVVHIPAGPEMPHPKDNLRNFIPEFIDGIQTFASTKSIQYDLIYSHYWLSGLAAIQLAVFWDIPIVHMFHTLALLKNEIARSDSERESEIRIDGEKQVIMKVDKIISATENEVEYLQNLYQADRDKIITIPPGVDTTHFYPIHSDEAKAFIGMPADEKMILFVGRIERLKGIDTLIKAIAQLHKADVLSQCPHYLYIIGGNPNEESDQVNQEMLRLQRLCTQLGVDDMILFLGKRDQDSLQYYYSAAEVVVMPSQYESFGMVALESMACGTPVIATQVGGLQHLVKDQETGFTVPHNDPNALEEKLTMLMCNQEMKVEMSKDAQEYAKTYAWEIVAKDLLNIFQKISKK